MWEQHIQELKDFKRQHGHCRVPKDDEAFRKLSTWIHHIRSSYARLQRGEEGEIDLTEERIAELKSLGLRLSTVNSEARGKRRLKELIEFRRINGHFQVPRNCTQFPRLPSWLAKLRIAYNKRQRGEDISSSKDSQLSELEKIGYEFHHAHVQNSRESNENIIPKGAGQQRGKRIATVGLQRGDLADVIWTQRVEELRKFKEEHGHFKVPSNDEAHRPLYNWMNNNQRHFVKLQRGERSARLTSDRVAQLTAIGFDSIQQQSAPDLDDFRWNQRMQELQKFKDEHGHFRVPSNTEAYNSLFHWLHNNHHHYIKLQKGVKSPRLTSERISQLKAIGFDFNEQRTGPNRDDVRWMQRVQELQKFKEDHGHFKVPGNIEAYKPLHFWVTNNQSHYNRLQKGEKSPRLTSERISKLTEIGFDFNQRGGGENLGEQAGPDGDDDRWNQRVQELQKFKEEHGHFKVPANVEAYKGLISWMNANHDHYNKLLRGEKSGRLTAERISQLMSIGFDISQQRFGPDPDGFRQRVYELQKFKEQHGHFKVPANVEAYKPLNNWVFANHRHYHMILRGEKSNRLTSERIAQLRSIGFEFNGKLDGVNGKLGVGEQFRHHYDDRWNQRVNELLKFKEQHGHYRVPANVEAYKPLHNWMSANQHHFHKLQKGEMSGRLTSERISQLRSIGFDFNGKLDGVNGKLGVGEQGRSPHDHDRWNQRVNELRKFKEQHGHFRVPANVEAYKPLNNWVSANQYHFHKLQKGETSGRLTKQRMSQLYAIGFDFNGKLDGLGCDDRWNQRVNELRKFKEQHGHFKVPANVEAYKPLNYWMSANQHHFQKLQKGEKSGRLTKERMSQLYAIGFDFMEHSAFNRQAKTWNERLQELKDFKDVHGHFNVPCNVEEYKALRSWLRNNRLAYNKFRKGERCRMTAERMNQLSEIGFQFSDTPSKPPVLDEQECPNERWNQRVQELKEFHDAHGHFDVPFNIGRYNLLADWMLNNRLEYTRFRKGVKSGRLTSERLAQLMEIGFNFNAPSCPIAEWNQRVQQLKDFNEKHGHFMVPNNVEAYKPLWSWLHNNETEYKNIQKGTKSSLLTDQRMAQLESIGFYFADTGEDGETGEGGEEWDERLNELKEFKEVLGHFDVPSDEEDYQTLSQWIAKNQEEYVKVQQGEKSSHLTTRRLFQLQGMGFHFKSTVARASIPKDAMECEGSLQRTSLHSSETASDSDGIVEVNDLAKHDGCNTSQTTSAGTGNSNQDLVPCFLL
eukprot:CAMPEP_0113639520 /NCGR_PEP_ID=MMETSP0017_2-20120614/20731_1 /TAXON_ID=2856 /ORGANISM="Cylindrotheca closterium" /LENGTH=1249 /DNA_ID=CAMNT_0000550735 /DNA_START=34 /DNA_END=3783 /DNA_ORIENTATION=- /assembly_acc=CAM_ASM_000147